MMQKFIFLPFFLLAVPAAALTSQEDSTITKVVKLLQEMLDKSKEDGTNDRTVYAKFKCYCDTTTEKKTKAIAETSAAIEAAEAQLEDLRAQNTKLSQEVAKLESDMAENKAAREEATALREKEKADFEKEEADLVTGIDQLERAYNLLAAIGADQTISGDTDSAQLMAGGASERAGFKGVDFLSKTSNVQKRNLGALDEDMKAALRAASVFLSGAQRSKLHSFLQAPFTGNYNAQSGEIVGVIKNMKDTFEANLESTRQNEEKKQKEYDEMMEIKTAEYDEMEELFEAKKKEIGDNAAQISTISSEVETMEAELASDQEFLAALTERCSMKKKEFEKRNMLRAGEEAAIAEAISILNSDAAFESFGKVDATSTGATGFIQLSESEPQLRNKVSKELILASRKVHSVRVARIAMAISDGNPFKKVLEMINKTIGIIEAEEADDVEKKETCIEEQTTNEKNRDDKEKDIQTLESNIDALKVAIEGTEESITLATEDLGLNRDSQASTTATRKSAHAVFTETLSNCEDAEKILAKAIEVLTKYYEFLHAHNAEKSYELKKGKDSGGGNMERLTGLSVEELETACSEKADCVGFNTAGWLKSSLADEAEWYDWDGGDLYVKMLNGVPAYEKPTQLLQTKQPLEGEPDSEFSSGQGESGNKAIDMLVFIAGETKAEKEQAISDEQASQMAFESEMQALTASETTLLENIDTYKLDLATQEKQLEETKEDLNTTVAEHAAIVKYLAEIEPGCEFIKANYDTRKQNREAEISALNEASKLLIGTPAYKLAEAKAARAAQGDCGPTCEELGDDHAKCQACLEGVTVFGYCSQNEAAPGCAEATATGSAAALE